MRLTFWGKVSSLINETAGSKHNNQCSFSSASPKHIIGLGRNQAIGSRWPGLARWVVSRIPIELAAVIVQRVFVPLAMTAR